MAAVTVILRSFPFLHASLLGIPACLIVFSEINFFFTKTEYHTNKGIPTENFQHDRKNLFFGKFLTWWIYRKAGRFVR